MGALAGTANWIFFLSLGSPSTSGDTEGSMALDPGGLTPSREERKQLEISITSQRNLPLLGSPSPEDFSSFSCFTPSESLSVSSSLRKSGKTFFHLLSSFALQLLLKFPYTSLGFTLSLFAVPLNLCSRSE